MVTITELTQALEALLPVAVTGTARNLARVAMGDATTGPQGKPSHVMLPHIPTAITAITRADGSAVDVYAADYLSGRLDLPTVAVGERVRIGYQFSIADDLIRQAINDLGRRLPRRKVARIQMHQNEGTLPDDLITLISVGDKPCCGMAVQVGGCDLFVSSNKLIAGCGVCPGHYQICYMGGYPCVGGVVDGLTFQLADLVLLKAQALAYRSPKVLLALSGLDVGGDESTTSDSGTEESLRTVTTVEETDRCERTKTTTTTERVTGSFDKEDSSSAEFLRSTDAGALADLYESQYQTGISALAQMAIIPERRIYRPRLGY